MRYHADHLLVAPDVVLERRDIEIADQDCALGLLRPDDGAVAHLVEKGELMREFRIEVRVGKVAAGGHIEIMHRDRIAETGALAEHRGNVAAIAFAAEELNIKTLERQPRQHDHAVIALLSVQRDMLIAQPLETLE